MIWMGAPLDPQRHYVASIGNFDGGHLGHQALIKALCEKAERLECEPVVFTFEPLTQEYFGRAAEGRLMRLSDKIQWLRTMGISQIGCLSFNQHLAKLSAEDFIEDYLKRYNIVHLISGEDFRFGSGRSGNADLLRAHQIEVTLIPAVGDETRVSSTTIRGLLREGQLREAALKIGRPYQFSGRVVHGDQRARWMGFPTANLSLERFQCPLKGVFQVNVAVEGRWRMGIANMGVRPTVGGLKSLCEVHLFDFNESLYGQRLIVEPVLKIREEKRFESLEQLRQQIVDDIKVVKNILKN